MRAMKDSGIPWIGEIPENWEVKRLKQESIFINGFAFDSEDFKIDEGVRVIRIGDIGLKADFENCVRAITNSSILKPYRIEDGDILIAMSGATTGKCCIVDKSEEAYINQRVGIIRSDIRKIIYYSLQTPYFMEFVNLNNAGSAQPNISSKAIGEFPILSIPPTEQQKIAEFLDRKCAEVDEMIALQEQIIEELKAYKQSVITEAVTKGLNPAAPMRDSGIDWIGTIPEHWEVSKVKWECAIMDYLREPISAENRKNELGLYDYYGASGVIDKIDDYNVDDKVLLIGEDGANLVMRNLPLLYKAEGKFWVNNHAHILKPLANNCYSYMAYMLEAGDYTHYITGSAQPKLSQDNIKNFIIPMPRDYTEQQAIADYLDDKCADIDSLIQTKQSKIDSLKEYKKSIIYEYVTGKLEVK